MTTVGMPGHGFTFPVGGIVPVIFSSMVYTALRGRFSAMRILSAHVVNNLLSLIAISSFRVISNAIDTCEV